MSFKPLLFIGVGLVLIYAGLKKSWNLIKLKRFGIETDGVVLRIERSGGAYYAVISFATTDNETIIKSYDFAAKKDTFEVGEIVTVLYMPNDNQNFIVSNSRDVFTGPAIFFSGVFFVVAAIVTYPNM